ncbi:MAG: hypothetical protein ACTS8S_08465 [Giesbergeria sp.]
MKELNIHLRSWSGMWLAFAALLAGAVFLWVGFALAIVLAVLAGVALLPSWMRSLWTRKHARRGPITIEGHCSKGEQ